MYLKDAYEFVRQLSLEEQKKLHLALGHDFEDTDPPSSQLIRDIRETRFHDGLACVHCGSKAVKRNGTYRARQRYLCHDCGRSFNDCTKSPMAGTRYPNKWLAYIQYMVEGISLGKIAEHLDIHLSTAFYWRHKVLYALRLIGFQPLQGIGESDETYFLESEKGKRDISHRKARKRGGSASKRGISKEQVCVLVAHDCNGTLLSKRAGYGRITATEIDEVMGHLLGGSLSLCTNEATNYKRFAELKSLEHHTINTRKKEYEKRGLYHIQHVNSYHNQLKGWLFRFRGVATKYLDNYLYWHQFLYRRKKAKKQIQTEDMFLEGFRRASGVTVEKMGIIA
ncbi:IS1595 family transposase [Bacillus sp. S13(2024)]|uniref:IS1595 family transposase n=1 Tax=unclassified Bacillus (in: firmicutes) TaxID=185979 RepID=UPI003D1AA5F2